MLRRGRWRIPAALLLAAATTYLVAWSSLLSPIPRRRVPLLVAQGPIPTPTGPDAVDAIAAWHTPQFDVYTSMSSNGAGLFTFPHRSVPLPEIAAPQILSQLSIKPLADQNRAVVVRGWPYRSIAATVSLQPGPSSAPTDLIETTNHGITLPARFRDWPIKQALPTLPLFPGFILDTALAAPLCWLIVYTPGAIRRRYRKLAHQCPHCAYDRRGLPPNAPCPECGRPQPA